MAGQLTSGLVDDDWKVKAGVSFDTNKAKGEWKGAGFMDFSSPDMSGIRTALHVSLIRLCLKALQTINLAAQKHRTELIANFLF